MLILMTAVCCWRIVLNLKSQSEIGKSGTCSTAVRLHQDGVHTDPWRSILRLAAAIYREPQLPHAAAQWERLAIVVRQADHVALARRCEQECLRFAQIPCGSQELVGEMPLLDLRTRQRRAANAQS